MFIHVHFQVAASLRGLQCFDNYSPRPADALCFDKHSPNSMESFDKCSPVFARTELCIIITSCAHSYCGFSVMNSSQRSTFATCYMKSTKVRQSFLTKRYSNIFYSDYRYAVYIYIHGTWYMVYTYMYMHMYVYMHGSCSATVCQSQHEIKAITVCQAFIMNSDERREARLRRRRERRAAESSEERETRLAKRRVADRARYAANSDGRTERRRERRAAESSEQRETRLLD